MRRITPILMFCILLICGGCIINTEGNNMNDDISQTSNDYIRRSISVSQQDDLSKYTDLTMTIIKIDYASIDNLEITLTNNTNMEAVTDNYYSIDYFNEDDWEEISLNFGVEDIEINLAPKESQIFTINLYPNQHEYQLGKYRVLKTVSVGKKTLNLTTEFNIGEIFFVNYIYLQLVLLLE